MSARSRRLALRAIGQRAHLRRREALGLSEALMGSGKGVRRGWAPQGVVAARSGVPSAQVPG
jgi:hypothetical protein